MKADKIPEEDLDEEVIKPLVEPEDSQAWVKYIQCVEVMPSPAGSEEVAMHEEKDGDWGGVILPPYQGVHGPARSKESSQELLTLTFKRGATSTEETTRAEE